MFPRFTLTILMLTMLTSAGFAGDKKTPGDWIKTKNICGIDVKVHLIIAAKEMIRTGFGSTSTEILSRFEELKDQNGEHLIEVLNICDGANEKDESIVFRTVNNGMIWAAIDIPKSVGRVAELAEKEEEELQKERRRLSEEAYAELRRKLQEWSGRR